MKSSRLFKALTGIVGFTLLSVSLQTQALTISELIASIRQHHPAILAAMARTQGEFYRREEAGTVFDPIIKQDTLTRPSGYYDGLYAEQTVIKPLQTMNAEVFGKYRISDGSFPVYEADLETLDRGEASIGVKLSLLQNRDTDKRRLGIDSANWKYQEALAKQDAELNKLIYAGVNAYLDWYQVERERSVIKQLVDLSRQRLSAMEQRFNAGDLPEFNVTEYRATVLSRELALQEADQKAFAAARKLSFYYRGDAVSRGDKVDSLPDVVEWPFSKPSSNEAWRDEIISRHPAMTALDFEREQARNKKRLARNETLPKLDLEMKLARDMGDGPSSLEDGEAVVQLAFSMPIGQRAARARESAADADIQSLEWEIRLLEDTLRRDIDIAINNLGYAEQLASLARQNADVASKLLEQERTRFDHGDSNQFVLINRESNQIRAKMKAIASEVDVMRATLSILATGAQLHNY